MFESISEKVGALMSAVRELGVVLDDDGESCAEFINERRGERPLGYAAADICESSGLVRIGYASYGDDEELSADDEIEQAIVTEARRLGASVFCDSALNIVTLEFLV